MASASALKQLLQGRASDGAALLATLDLALPSSGMNGLLTEIPQKVVFEGRRADVNTVDRDLEDQGWILTSPLGAAITPAGRAVVENDVDDECKGLVRGRLEKWAQEVLRREIADVVGDKGAHEWPLLPEHFWALTRGLWLLCASSDDDTSHGGFANYVMNSRWWSVLGFEVAGQLCSELHRVLVDKFDREQCSMAVAMVTSSEPLVRFFELDVISEIPQRFSCLKRWMFEMNELVHGTKWRSLPWSTPEEEGWEPKPFRLSWLGLSLWSNIQVDEVQWFEMRQDYIESHLEELIERSSLGTAKAEVELLALAHWVEEMKSEMTEAQRVELCFHARHKGLDFSEAVVFYDCKAAVLIEARADVDAIGTLAMSIMAAIDKAKLFVGPELTALLKTPLSEAHKPESKKARNKLKQFSSTCRSLSTVIREGHVEAFRLTLILHPRFDVERLKKGKILQSIASSGNLEMANIVVEECGGEVDVDAVMEGSKWTPLYQACWGGNRDFALWLLNDAGSKAHNMAAFNKITPLMGACAWGMMEVVQVLVAGGADPSAVDQYGTSCIAWAEGRNHPDIAEFLRAEILRQAGVGTQLHLKS